VSWQRYWRTSINIRSPSKDNMSIRVLLADDSEIVRKAITHLLQSDPEIQLVAEAVSFRQAMRFASRLRPQVIVMDLHMPDENNLTPLQIKSCFVGSRLLAISLWNDEETKVLADGCGAVTLLDKTNLGALLIPAMKQYANYHE
jgi:two-component system invasion response regulator UvrY